MMKKSRKKLPAGWEMKTLGEVCAFINRGISPRYIESGGLRVLNQKCIRDHRVNMELGRYHDNLIKIVPEEKYIKYGDVLVNSTGTGTLGRVAQVLFDSNATVDSHVTIVRPKPNLFVLTYFGYGMIAIEEEIAQRGQGCGGQIELSRDDLKKTFYISYPQSHYEQQRIVAKLDEAFTEIVAAKANIERNLQNCKELFQSELNAVFANNKGWKEKKLGNIAFVKSGGTPSRAKKEFWEGDIPWYSSGELNELYTKESERFINNLAIENSNAKLFPKGSLLIGMYDTAALKMSIIDRDATFNQAIAGVEPNENINLVYILHAINSKKEELLNQRRGVRQKNLSLEKIKNISILFPSIEIQKQIVNQLDGLSSRTKELEANYQLKLSSLEKLKKSILQKAFNGEL